MPTRTQHIAHKFSGGWAPDFGRLVSGLPTQEGQTSIPHVLEADNIFWTIDDAFKQVGGTQQISPAFFENAPVTGLYDYWRIGFTGNATRRKVMHTGTLLVQDRGTDSWALLSSGLELGAHPHYCTFSDLLIVASDSASDVPISWDQTTSQPLAGSPPNFSFCQEHKNRVWAAGVRAFPSRLYYCAADDPEDWIGTGSGFIDISPGDGDEITGLASFKNELFVFKGPNKGSIHRISGSTPVDFARAIFIRGLAAAGQSTIAPFRDDILFMTPSGSIRSLKATAAFGDYIDSAITFPINSWLVDNFNSAQSKRCWLVNDPTESRVYVAIATGSSSTNNEVLVFDYQFASLGKPDRWSHITAWDVNALGLFTLEGRPKILAGGTDGIIRRVATKGKSIDGITPIQAAVHTPALNYGSSTRFKTIDKVSMTVAPSGPSTIDFYWNRDTKFSNTITVDQGLIGGVALGEFLLGSDVLGSGGSDVNEVFADLDEGGDFRWIQYRFEQEAIDQDVFLFGFSVGLQFDAYGTENV